MARVKYDRSLSPTAAAVKFNNDLAANGINAINLGQGREIENAPASIFPADGITISPDSGYNPKPGGQADACAIAAAYVERMLGIKGVAFIAQTNGRDASANVLNFIATKINPTDSNVLIPALHWPMYQDQIGQVRGAKPAYYDAPSDLNPTPALPLEGAMVVTLNSPQNPTGKQYGKAYMQAVAAQLEAANANAADGHKVGLHLDLPYFYALPETAEVDPTASAEDPYFAGHFECLTKSDAKTPWFAVVSFSKALGTARPGLTFIVVHPDYAPAFSRFINARSGVSYAPEFFDEVAQKFGTDMDDTHLDHFDELRCKYGANFDEIRANFKEDQIVDGDPGMTALLKLSDMKGKTIMGSDGEPWHIQTPADFIEYAGNELRVVCVDNGETAEGDFLIRVALAQRPQNFAIGIDRVRQAHKAVVDAPMAAPRPEGTPAAAAPTATPEVKG